MLVVENVRHRRLPADRLELTCGCATTWYKERASSRTYIRPRTCRGLTIPAYNHSSFVHMQHIHVTMLQTQLDQADV